MMKMFPKRRGILVLLAILILVTAAVGGAIPFLPRGLPDPAKATRDELLRWLITKDLAKEPPPTQLAIARRLETEFAAGVDWSSFKDRIDDSQCRQLLKNIPCVLRPWILEKADAYEQLAAEGKNAFVDRLIDTLDVWRGVEKLLPKQAENSQDPANSPKLTAILMQEMEKLQKESPPSKQEQINQLWMAVQMRMVLRSFAPKT
jgi:hypothetical protein